MDAPREAMPEGATRDPGAGSGFAADIRSGFRTLVEVPWIGLTIAVAGLTNITLAGPLESAMPLLVSEHLHAGVGFLGVVGASTAIGSVAAAVLLGARRTLRHRGLLIYLPWAALAIATATMGLPIGLLGVVIAAAVVGAGETTLGLAWVSALQDRVPQAQLGRVSSLDALGSYALIPIGYFLAGVAADAVGPALVFLVGGIVSAAILLAVLLVPSVRHLD